MKLHIELNVVQYICETHEIEVDDDTNLRDFMFALNEDPSIIFGTTHPNIVATADLIDSESYDSNVTGIYSVKVKN